MSHVGRRLRLNRHAGCGQPGDYGVVVLELPEPRPDNNDPNAVRVYIVMDNCVCTKPHPALRGGGCDGVFVSKDGPYNNCFSWIDEGKPLPNMDGSCSCDWGHIMTFGCSCGGK